MYAAFFGLQQNPFSIAPDPRFLFMSERHREALAHLLYGLDAGGGFVLLSGDIGTGKTTVCRLFLDQIPANCNVAYIFNPKLTETELLQSICDEFHVVVPKIGAAAPTVKDLVDPLNAFLLEAHAAGRNNVLIIDEAQNLSAGVLEQLRLLTNLETAERKLLQIILIGQPELRSMLARPELEQLAQRVIARYHLDALSVPETAQYVRHRLEVAGLERPMPFDRAALYRIHQLSRGVPRRINLLCDRALLGAFAQSRAVVDKSMVSQAAREVFGAAARPASAGWRRAGTVGLGLAMGAGLFALGTYFKPAPPTDGNSIAALHPPARSAAPASSVAAGSAVVAGVAAAPDRLPSGSVFLRDRDAAWRELAVRWKADAGQGAPCPALASAQLQCFTRKLSLATVRQLDRPGILTLDADSAQPAYAILTGLTRGTATLQAAGREQVIPLSELTARWRGEFSTLWRAPAGDLPGVQGAIPSLEWIAARLPASSPEAPASDAAAAQAQFQARLRAFQRVRGVPADGVAGPMTLMQLNRAAGIDEPRLRLDS